MSRADHIHRVCMSLLALPTWTANLIFHKYAWQLDVDHRPPPATKKYRGKIADPCFDTVTLRQPVYGGKLGWALTLDVQHSVAISYDELAPSLPAQFEFAVHPPAPGGVGPSSTRTSRTWKRVDGRMTMQFERTFGTASELLKSVSLGRDKAADPPGYDQPERYRAVECTDEHGHSYLIEEGTSLEQKMRVEDVLLRERMLKLSYTCIDPLIGELLARRLIRRVLLGRLMQHELEGKVDRIEYTDLESKHSVIKRWLPTAEKP